MSLNQNTNLEIHKYDMNKQEIQPLLDEPILSRVFPI